MAMTMMYRPFPDSSCKGLWDGFGHFSVALFNTNNTSKMMHTKTLSHNTLWLIFGKGLLSQELLPIEIHVFHGNVSSRYTFSFGHT